MTRRIDVDIQLPSGAVAALSAGAQEDGLSLTVSVDYRDLLLLAEALTKAAAEASSLGKPMRAPREVSP